MSLIDRAATFRGRITDHGVGKTKNSYPQWVAQLVALEIYDDEERVWIDWSEYDVNEITAYIVLFGGKGETLAVKQLQKITNWSGESFSELNELDLSETKIQFRVEENTYENKTSLQVAWIDEYNAEPGRVVRKLDDKDLKALDAQYKKFMGKKPTPTKVSAKGIKPTQPKGPVKKKKAKDPPIGSPEVTPPTPPPLPTPPAPPNTDLPSGRCTKQEAWETVYDLKAQNVDDQKIAEIWTGAVHKVAPGVEQKDVTDEQWFKVREIVLNETAVF